MSAKTEWLREQLSSWLGILVSAIAVISTIVGACLWALDHFQSVDDARRTAAWQARALADQKVLVLRNRVNDCDIRKEQQPPMSVLERTACRQYLDEFNYSVEAASEALRVAKSLSR